MVATIETQQQRVLVNCNSAHEMWLRLSTQHLRNAAENQHVLQQRFYEYQFQPDHDMLSHITEIETMAAQLNDVGAPITPVQLITKIICTLPPSYRSFTTAWDSVPANEKTIALLTSRLLKEEAMAKRWNNGNPDVNDAAFFAQNYSHHASGFHSTRGRGRGRGSGHHSRPYFFCEYCKKAGHTAEKCRTRLRHHGNAIVKSTQDQHHAAAAVSLVEGQDQSQTGSINAEKAFLSSVNSTEQGSLEWYADSGATQHMTWQNTLFKSFTSVTPGSWTVKGIGSAKLTVYGYGDIEFVVTTGDNQRKAVIEKVLYVPGLGTNLISIAAVTDVGLSVLFVETRVSFTKDQVIVMVGRRIGNNLYQLSIIPKNQHKNQTKDLACFVQPKPTDITTWHQRLAHVSYKTITKMMSENLVDGLDFATDDPIPTSPCLGCVSGKMHRSPFPIGRTKASQIGQLIHSDVCGPMHVATPGGARYFVLFIDDFSGWRAVYFLKQKSEVADSFKVFLSVLRSDTSHLVHTLRSDNGGEFTNSSFKNWLAQKNIKLETSAPHTPEQNGVSERANRTILEAAKSLLHAKHLPLELWGEAVSCAVYTLNRVKNSTSSATPYQLWHGKKPDVSHLRVFGCLAFIHIPKSERQKLDCKSLKCYFVGYSTTQKAYRFWDPVGRKLKISRDVIFDEHSDHLSLPLQEIEPCVDYEKVNTPTSEMDASSNFLNASHTARQVEGELS